MRALGKHLKIWVVSIVVIACVTLTTSLILAQYIKTIDKRDISSIDFAKQFPVTVDPINKTIIEDERVGIYFQNHNFNTQAVVLSSINKFGNILLEQITSLIQDLVNRNLALVSGEKIVTIQPGLRKEQVANIFARALVWNEKEKKEFISLRPESNLPLTEGSFSPGIYVVEIGSKPQDVQDLVNKRFTNNVLSYYATSTAEIVPLHNALVIASLIQRETIGTDDMRLISGVIWNRIFADMNLQLDATLQYIKASNKKTSVWWPEVEPRDKFIKSPYNTYMHKGLPPNPIANPSVAAIIAALNPLKTTCMFYFHDKNGDMHCTATYKEHVALLKQYYGRGK